MDLQESGEAQAFRMRLRAWLQSNLPSEPEPVALVDRWPYMRAFQKRLYDAGWAALSYPVEVGGQGLGPAEESILSEELGRANAPTLLPIGHLAKPLLAYGTDVQRRRHLPTLLSAEEVWCQGFSEPEAGSDLAALKTVAVEANGVWTINGHKIWTSYGAHADYCLLLARTDPGSARHRGISAFIVAMDSPGVTARPIVLANGDEEFAEVFLDDVQVPADNLVGGVGEGWRIAMEVVNYERSAVDIGYLPKFERYLAELVAIASNDAEVDRATVRAIGEVAASLQVLRMHCLRNLCDRIAGAPPGPEASIGKLLMTRVEQDLMRLSLEVATDVTDGAHQDWFDRYLFARAASIYGGSGQIQRNILAQRMLGLPIDGR